MPPSESYLLVSLGGLIGSSVLAQDLVFPIGEDARFAWSDLERFEDDGPQRPDDPGLRPLARTDRDLVLSVFAYFEEATGATSTTPAPTASSSRS
jgi:alpha-glucoside transport system substrate-binding protein